MIQVKAPVTGWHTVSAEQALRFATVMVNGSWTSRERALEYLNARLLKGIKFSMEDIESGRDI